jgi:hypothetical protein
MKREAIALLPALLAAAAAHAAPADTGILAVSSEYEQGTRETGSGFTVAYKDKSGKERLLLVTCAHLTGGGEVRIGDQPLARVSLGQRTDAYHDIDVIELDPDRVKVPVFARYKNLEGPGLEVWRRWHREWEEKSGKTAAYRDPIGALVVNESALPKWKSRTLRVEVPQGKGHEAVSLVPPWTAPGIAEPTWTGRRRTWEQQANRPPRGEALSLDVVGGTYHAPARIAPGMSCSPLFDPAKTLQSDGKGIALLGMGIEYKNRLADSTFASTESILLNISAYANGEEIDRLPAKWKSQHGILYLEVGEGRAEIVPSHTAGNGLSTPPGNGLSTPPGNGQSTPPGNGLSTPPGSNAPREACNPYRKSPTDNERIGTPPAVLWDGKPVMGFQMTLPGSKQPYLLFPDRVGMKLRMLAEKHGAHFEDVPLGAEILPWFDRVYSEKGKSFGDSYVARSAATGIDTAGPEIERHPDHLVIRLHGPPPEREKIEFQLDKHGALIGSGAKPELQPVIEVAAPSGRVYIVDLTSLFHSNGAAWDSTGLDGVELSLAKRAWAGDASLRDYDALAGVKKGLKRTLVPEISFRPKCSRNEYHFRLTELSPLTRHENPAPESGHAPGPSAETLEQSAQ